MNRRLHGFILPWVHRFLRFLDSSILCTPVSILRWVMKIVKKFLGSSTFWSVEKRLLSCFHIWEKQRIEIIYWASIQVVIHGVLSLIYCFRSGCISSHRPLLSNYFSWSSLRVLNTVNIYLLSGNFPLT